jgi:hypothetical protein
LSFSLKPDKPESNSIACSYALARANRVFGTDRNHPYQKHGYGQKQRRLGLAFIQDRRLRADGFSSVQRRNSGATRAMRT